MREILAGQLDAIRAQVGGLQAQLDALAMMLELETTRQPQCPHTETEMEGTFGDTVMRCVACHALV